MTGGEDKTGGFADPTDNGVGTSYVTGGEQGTAWPHENCYCITATSDADLKADRDYEDADAERKREENRKRTRESWRLVKRWHNGKGRRR